MRNGSRGIFPRMKKTPIIPLVGYLAIVAVLGVVAVKTAYDPASAQVVVAASASSASPSASPSLTEVQDSSPSPSQRQSSSPAPAPSPSASASAAGEPMVATSASPTASASAPGTVKPISYVVKKGDTLSDIAHWFMLNGYQELYQANINVIGENPNLIYPGQRITITRSGGMTIG